MRRRPLFRLASLALVMVASRTERGRDGAMDRVLHQFFAATFATRRVLSGPTYLSAGIAGRDAAGAQFECLGFLLRRQRGDDADTANGSALNRVRHATLTQAGLASQRTAASRLHRSQSSVRW